MNINAYGVSVASLLLHGCNSAHTGISSWEAVEDSQLKRQDLICATLFVYILN